MPTSRLGKHGDGNARRSPVRAVLDLWSTWLNGRGGRWRRNARLLVITGVVLLGLRAIAPIAIRAAVEDRLNRIPAYSGSVGDVDLHLWRGAYALDEIDVRKRSDAVETPFFSAGRIDFSLAWRDIMRGRVVADIVVDRGRLAFIKAETEAASQLETDRRWQDAIQDVFPIEITRLEITRGQVHWVDRTLYPHIDVSLHDVSLLAIGLRNRSQAASDDVLPAWLQMAGKTVGNGDLRVDLRLAPLERPPRFDLDVAVTGVPLPALNDLLRAYARVDVSRGTFEAYLEVAARDGAYRGYVKPFLRDLNFENVTDRDRPIPEKIWESVANFLEELLKNPERRQLGTRVPFSGDFSGTEVGTFTAIGNAVRYAFGAAFSEAVEGTLEPSDVAPADDRE